MYIYFFCLNFVFLCFFIIYFFLFDKNKIGGVKGCVIFFKNKTKINKPEFFSFFLHSSYCLGCVLLLEKIILSNLWLNQNSAFGASPGKASISAINTMKTVQTNVNEVHALKDTEKKKSWDKAANFKKVWIQAWWENRYKCIK